MQIRRTGVLLGGLTGVGALLLSGCTSSGPTPAAAAPTGVTASTHTSGASAGTPSPGASPSGTAPAQGGTTGAKGAAPVPALRPKPNAHGLPCNAQGLVVHLAQASGAVHGYLAKPGTSGPTVIALRNRTAAATGARAARYGATHLTAGLSSAAGCATTGALGSVAKQTSTYLVTLGRLLQAGRATKGQVAAAEALIADVTSQAKRTGIVVVDRVPATSLLAQHG